MTISWGFHIIVRLGMINWIARGLVDGVFGEGSAALEKAVDPCLKADIIGWSIDLETETIRPSDKGIRKLMFAFYMVDALASHWPLTICQLLSSLAQRYSAALIGMRPFVSAFYEMCGGSSGVNLRRVTPNLEGNVPPVIFE